MCTFEVKETSPQREFLKQYEEKIKKQAKEKRQREDAYVGLARKTIETYVRIGEMISLPTDLPEDIKEACSFQIWKAWARSGNRSILQKGKQVFMRRRKISVWNALR